MSVEKNKAVVLRLLDEVWSNGNFEVLDELVTADYVYHEPHVGDIPGPEGLKQTVMMYRSAYPDLIFESEMLIAEGDYVVNRWRSGGTHKGELMGVPATGKQTTSHGINIMRFENGKIAEDWTSWDSLQWLQQVGALPAMG